MTARGAEVRLDCITVVGRDGARPESLSVVVAPGAVTVLTGPNGAGKSTVLQVVLGLTAPTSGRVTIDGIDVADVEPQAWWRQVAWLAQRPGPGARHCKGEPRSVRRLEDYETACREQDSMRFWRRYRTDSTRCSGAAASGYHWGNANDSGWRVHSGRVRRCCCSTSPPPIWMRPRSRMC